MTGCKVILSHTAGGDGDSGDGSDVGSADGMVMMVAMVALMVAMVVMAKRTTDQRYLTSYLNIRWGVT